MKQLKFLALSLATALLAACTPTSTPTVPSVEPTIDPTTEQTTPTTNPLLDFTVSTNNITLIVGVVEQIEISITDFEYEVEDPTICQFSSKGLIKGLKEGTTVVTISKEGYNSQKITVNVILKNVELDGLYYSGEDVLLIDESTVTLNGISYNIENSEKIKNKNIELEKLSFTLNSETKIIEFITHPYDEQAYQVKFNDKVFQPSIKELAGSYSYYGDGNKNNIFYLFGDSFDDAKNLFDIGVVVGTKPTDFYYTAESFYKLVDGERKTAVNIYDQDDYFCFSLYFNEKTNTLYDYDYQMDMLYEDAGIFHSTFYTQTSNGVNFSYSPENKSIKVENETYSLETKYSKEEGLYYEFGNNKITFNSYGINLNSSDSSVEMLIKPRVFKTGYFIGDGLTLNVEENLDIYLNGSDKPLQYEEVFYNHSYAFKTEDLIIEIVNENTLLYHNIQSNKASYLFHNEYIETIYTGFRDAIIDGEQTRLMISINGAEINVNIFEKNHVATTKYDKANNLIYLQFDGNKTLSTTKLFEKPLEYKVDGKLIAHYFNNLPGIDGEYTSNGRDTLEISKNSAVATLDETTYNLTLFAMGSEDSLTHLEFFVNGSKMFEYYYQNISLYNEEGVMTKNFIPFTYIQGVQGTYSFNGPFGIESFVIDNEYRLFADTLINKELVKKEYSYSFMLLERNFEKIVTLLIDYNGVVIYAYLDNHVLEVMDTNYAIQGLFYAEGVYVSGNDVINIYQGEVYYNGSRLSINEYNEHDNTVSFTSTSVGKIKINLNDRDFNTSTNELIVSFADSDVTFTQQTTYLDHFVGTYQNSILGTVKVEAILNPFTGLESGFQLSYLTTVIENYTIKNYEGSYAMVFSDLNYEFVLYLKNGDIELNVVTKGSVPPPPPPPPPLF